MSSNLKTKNTSNAPHHILFTFQQLMLLKQKRSIDRKICGHLQSIKSIVKDCKAHYEISVYLLGDDIQLKVANLEELAKV